MDVVILIFIFIWRKIFGDIIIKFWFELKLYTTFSYAKFQSYPHKIQTRTFTKTLTPKITHTHTKRLTLKITHDQELNDKAKGAQAPIHTLTPWHPPIPHTQKHRTYRYKSLHAHQQWNILKWCVGWPIIQLMGIPSTTPHPANSLCTRGPAGRQYGCSGGCWWTAPGGYPTFYFYSLHILIIYFDVCVFEWMSEGRERRYYRAVWPRSYPVYYTRISHWIQFYSEAV